MLQYVLAGLALGSIYAIASASLVVTYVSAGVLNFAFGSMAFVVARFYYWLNSQQGWPSYDAGLVALLGLAPVMGIVLYLVLFRFLRGKSTLVKLVATIGLSVALPPIMFMIFSDRTITSAPGLASLQSQTKPFHFLGAAVTQDQVITYGFLIFVVVAGTAILRLTDVGLKVRAMVDSEAMTSLSGTSPNRVALGVWAVSATLAGLAGILAAPTDQLTPEGMTALMAAAFAPVVASRLRSLPGAVVISLVMGVVTDVIQKYLPANSSITANIIPSIPFGFILIALIVYLVRSGDLQEDAGVAGPLDQAIRPANQDSELTVNDTSGVKGPTAYLPLFPLVIVGLLPIIFRGSPYWLGLVALGMCYAVTLLTFTMVTGEGGMLWLSQIIFAGAGALATGQAATVWHIPVLLGVLIGGVISAVVGAIIGLLTIRLGDLYVGLVTLTFGLLVEQLVFTQNRFSQGGIGVALGRPSFATSDFTFSYLAFAVFIVIGILALNLRRSTSGLALRAVRDSEPAARTLGLSVLQVKVIVGALAAFVAAVGGGFLAMDTNVAQPQSYATFAGLIWLAVVVTMGIRSITAAALSGVAFSLLPGLFTSYVSPRWGYVPQMLFGLGAISVARHPEGAIAQNGRQLRMLLSKLIGGGPEGESTTGGPGATGSRSDQAGAAAAAVGSGGATIKAEAAQ